MSVKAPTPPVAPAAPAAVRLPPGPPLPAAAQTLAFIAGGRHWLAFCQRRYGGAVFLRTLFDDGFVMVFDPQLVRTLFQSPHEQLNAGEANALLGPLLGERSVLVLDGVEHLRQRKLLLGPFHGPRLRGYEEEIRAATDRAIESWPVGRSFAVHPSLQTLTLEVIVRAVFGYAGAAADELTTRLRAMVDPVVQPRGMLGLFVLPRLGLDRTRERFAAARREVDALLFAEIERRRADPGLAGRDDVFSALLLAEDEAGERLSGQEVRDELVTLLVAGHETTATGLAWTLDLLLHSPETLERAQAREPAYLDAVIKEALRLRCVIPAVGRVVRGAPFALGEWVIPDGVEINPAIRTMHGRADLYPEPERFWPERFLGPDAPDTYTWLPFGGGTRRCLGASFAQFEMRIALDRILQRTRLEPARFQRDEPVFRAITLAPKHGVRVIQRVRPGTGGPWARPYMTVA